MIQQGLRFTRNMYGKPFLDPSSVMENKFVHHNMTHTTGIVGEAVKGRFDLPSDLSDLFEAANYMHIHKL